MSNSQFETSVIDALFLELSQITKSRTAREIDLERKLNYERGRTFEIRSRTPEADDLLTVGRLVLDQGNGIARISSALNQNLTENVNCFEIKDGKNTYSVTITVKEVTV